MEDIGSIMACRRLLRPWFRTSVLVLLLCLLFGCGGPKFEGKWVGDMGLKGGPAHIVGAASKVEVEFLPNYRFRLLRVSMPLEGTYDVKDGKAHLNVETFLDRKMDPWSADAAMNRGITIEPRRDGTLLMNDPHALGDTTEIILKRAQPEA